MFYRNAVTDPPPVADEYIAAIDVGVDEEDKHYYYYTILPFTPEFGWNTRKTWTAKEVKKWRIDNVAGWMPVPPFDLDEEGEPDEV